MIALPYPQLYQLHNPQRVRLGRHIGQLQDVRIHCICPLAFPSLLSNDAIHTWKEHSFGSEVVPCLLLLKPLWQGSRRRWYQTWRLEWGTRSQSCQRKLKQDWNYGNLPSWLNPIEMCRLQQYQCLTWQFRTLRRYLKRLVTVLRASKSVLTSKDHCCGNACLFQSSVDCSSNRMGRTDHSQEWSKLGSHFWFHHYADKLGAWCWACWVLYVGTRSSRWMFGEKWLYLSLPQS